MKRNIRGARRRGGSAPPARAPRCLALLALLLALRCSGATTWTRLQAPNFTILSALSEKETRNWALEFEQFHRGLGQFLKLNEAALQPVTVVLFGDDRDMQKYKPLEKGRPAKMAGLFLRCGLGNFIEVSDYFDDEQTRLVVYHETVHWLTNVSDTPLPLWMSEGLAETFSTFTIEGNKCVVGRPLPWHVALLNKEGMMPLKELVNVQHGSLLYNEGQRTSIFYAESWAFVHYLIFSGKEKEGSLFNELARVLRPGTDPDAAFLKVFGVNCAGMDKRLADYLHGGRYYYPKLTFDPKAVAGIFTVRPAAPDEVDLTLGCLLAAVGRPQEAMPRLDRILEATPRNPVAWEARGFAAFQDHDYGETLECFRKAQANGSRNFFVYSYLGDDALGLSPEGAGMQSTANGNGRIAADYYEQDLALNPADQHAYDNIGLNVYPLDAVSDADIRTLEQGVKTYPHDASIRVGLACAALKRGMTDIALKALRTIADDRLPSDEAAAATARTILDNQQGTRIADRMNALMQSQDFDGMVACADEALKTELPPDFRGQLVHQREWAQVAGRLKKAAELINDGKVDEGRKILEEADPGNKAPELHPQIQDILESTAKHDGPP